MGWIILCLQHLGAVQQKLQLGLLVQYCMAFSFDIFKSVLNLEIMWTNSSLIVRNPFHYFRGGMYILFYHKALDG